MADKSTVLKQTQKLIAKGQIDKAIALWVEYVENNPDASIYNTIGDLYLKNRDKNNSIQWFHKAATLYRNEGFSLKALAIYKKMLNIDSSDPEALLALGELNEEKGLTPDAIRFYLAAVDALTKRGRKDEVMGIYNKILAISPSNLPLRMKIVEYYIKEGFNKDASQELVHIARMLEEKGESEKAVEHFNRAIELFPQNKEAFMSMSKLYETLGKRKEASDILVRAMETFPDDIDLKLQLVELHVNGGNFDEATSLLKQIAEKEPDNISIKEQIANIHLLKGNREKAWEVYRSIIDELMMLKNPEQLIETLSELSDVEPVETGKKLASLYKETGNNEKAFEEFLKVGRILKDSGMHEEALSMLNEAHQLRPDDEEVAELTAELKKAMGLDQPVAPEEKPIEEAITEAEIFLRYGQTDEARKLLESLKSREPENIHVHRKLKALYVETGEKEMAVTECLVLANLYEKEGSMDLKEQMLNEAFEIDPQDPRLEARATAVPQEEVALSPTGLEDVGAAADNIEEELSEADFYFRQGLYDEALKIYQKLQQLMPDNTDIAEKIKAITSGGEESPAAPEEIAETAADMAPAGTGDTAEEFENLTIEDSEPVSAEEIPEPALANDVLEIFEEFKKGIETELDEEDSETHYNLGIAYKEMGLIDDAIKEFQTAGKDPGRAVQSFSMLGICYMEKGLYSLAVEALQKSLSQINEKDEAYWGTKYDLAEAYEKNGNINEALEIYTEIYSHDSKFRKVDEKLNSLKGAGAARASQQPARKKKDRISYI